MNKGHYISVMQRRQQRKLNITLPEAESQESPVAYAERLGSWYGQSISDDHRKKHGHYLTPALVATFMGMLAVKAGEAYKILDPAAGAGILAAAACEAVAKSSNPPKKIELILYEVDTGLYPVLEAVISHLTRWLKRSKIELHCRVEWNDFVLSNAGMLGGGILPSTEKPTFDAVICNPPYFKIPKHDQRAQVCLPVVKGQPNIYALFMAVSSALLKSSGRFVFITPRSYASGQYFNRFREYFFDLIKPTHLHVFKSREEAFDDVLQETVITAGVKQKKVPRHLVELSTSVGAGDIEERRSRQLRLEDVFKKDCKQRILYLPTDERDDQVRQLFGKWGDSLRSLGFEVSTGPVVAFRARDFLREARSLETVPLLWLQHVKSMQVSWPLSVRKAQYIIDCDESSGLLLPIRNYVVTRRFSAKEEKRRVVAAPLLRRNIRFGSIGLENHLNYIYKRQREMSQAEAYGIAAFLNSEVVDTYFRIGNGNTQVSATELRALPVPSLQVITSIGKRVMANPDHDIDVIVNQEIQR